MVQAWKSLSWRLAGGFGWALAFVGVFIAGVFVGQIIMALVLK